MAYKAFSDRPKKRVVLSDPHYWVELHTTLSYGERKQVSNKELSDIEIADTALKILICDWNLDDENGVIVPISADAIEKLDENDVATITEALIEIVNPPKEQLEAKNKEKKSTSEESIASSQAEQPTG